MKKDVDKLKSVLAHNSRIMFAYLHGSFLKTENPQDVDVAVYLFPETFERLHLDGEVNLSFAIPLEMELEKQLKKKVDVQILNRAPLGFRYSVVTDGVVMDDKDSDIRCAFEYISRVEYYDFRPKRNEYLREVMT